MKTIDYASAIKRFGNSYVRCNNVPAIDPTLWENTWFDPYNEYGDLIDIFQYYITDCDETDVRFLSAWYGLKFAYSEELECFILLVDHWGTPWTGVMIEDNSPEN